MRISGIRGQRLEEEEKKGEGIVLGKSEKFGGSTQEVDKERECCKVCYEEMGDPGSRYALQDCRHSFHRSCLKDFWESEISQSKFPLTCMQSDCRTEAFEFELNEILSRDSFLKY